MRSRCQQAEAIMSGELAARYQRALSREAEYWETGNSFGGRFFRDYELEAEMLGDLHDICCEALGQPPYDSRPIDPELLMTRSVS